MLAPAPAFALVTVDDRARMRLGSSRHRLTVAKGRKTVLLRIEAVNRGEDPHDVAIRPVNGRRIAVSGTIAPRGGVRRFRVRLRPGNYVLFCTIAARTPLSHERAGMRDTLRVLRRT